MNIVIDDAAEVYVKDVKPRRELGSLHLPQSSSILIFVYLGRILLKGDNITLIQQAN